MRQVGSIFICVAMGALLTGTSLSKADGVVPGSRPPTVEERQPHDDREQKSDEPGSAYVLRRILLAQLQPAARIELFRLADRATQGRLLEASTQPSTNQAATRPDLDTFGSSTILASGGAASTAALLKLLSNPVSYRDEDPFQLSVD